MYKDHIRPTLSDPCEFDAIVVVADCLVTQREAKGPDMGRVMNTIRLFISKRIGPVGVSMLCALLPPITAPGEESRLNAAIIADAVQLPRVVVFAACMWRIATVFSSLTVEAHVVYADLCELVETSGVTAGDVIACMDALNTCHLLGNDNPISRGIVFAADACNVFCRNLFSVERFQNNMYDRRSGDFSRDTAILSSSDKALSGSGVCAASSHLAWVFLFGHNTPDAAPHVYCADAPYSLVPCLQILGKDRLPFVFTRDEKRAALAAVSDASLVDACLPVLRVYALAVQSGYQTVCDCFRDTAPVCLAAPHLPDMCIDYPIQFFSACACPRLYMTDTVLLRVVMVLISLCYRYNIPTEIGAMIASFVGRDVALFYASPHPRIGLPSPRAQDPALPLCLLPKPTLYNKGAFL
jgi:hypothetical protein